MEKLVKYVARVSTFSRRKSEELIKSGKVKVNKIVVTEPSSEVKSEDSVFINNERIQSNAVKLYIALYKPDGYMSDLQDPRGRKVARDLIKIDMKLFPVGRLDYHSEGLMIFTNDGDFANKIIHPRYEIEKEYLVKFKGSFSKEEIKKINQGILIDGEIYKIDEMNYLRTAVKQMFREKTIIAKKTPNHRSTKKSASGNDEIKNVWYSVIIKEGKNRMIRKIGDAIKHPVLKIKRVRMGSLQLGDLQPGEYRYFEKKEALKSVRSSKKPKNV
jgi:23S rRNA pseudouridine2605 synthase